MRRSVKIRARFAACCFLILLCLSACAHNEADGGFADNQVSESEYDTTGTESDGESPVAGNSQEPAAESKESGRLSSVEDIGLHAVDESGRNYAFSYHQEEFSARYTPDNWKVEIPIKLRTRKILWSFVGRSRRRTPYTGGTWNLFGRRRIWRSSGCNTISRMRFCRTTARGSEARRTLT